MESFIDDFVCDGEEPLENDELADTLRSYGFSIIAVLSLLYNLPINCFHKEELAWSKGWNPFHFLHETHQEEECRITLDLMQALGQQLEEDYFNLVEIKF
jgi:hypothetical protein